VRDNTGDQESVHLVTTRKIEHLLEKDAIKLINKGEIGVYHWRKPN